MYQKLSHKVPQTGTLKLGGGGGGHWTAVFGKNGDEIKSWDENWAPNWLSHIDWFGFHMSFIVQFWICITCVCAHSYSLTSSLNEILQIL